MKYALPRSLKWFKIRYCESFIFKCMCKYLHIICVLYDYCIVTDQAMFYFIHNSYLMFNNNRRKKTLIQTFASFIQLDK